MSLTRDQVLKTYIDSENSIFAGVIANTIDDFIEYESLYSLKTNLLFAIFHQLNNVPKYKVIKIVKKTIERYPHLKIEEVLSQFPINNTERESIINTFKAENKEDVIEKIMSRMNNYDNKIDALDAMVKLLSRRLSELLEVTNNSDSKESVIIRAMDDLGIKIDTQEQRVKELRRLQRNNYQSTLEANYQIHRQLDEQFRYFEEKILDIEEFLYGTINEYSSNEINTSTLGDKQNPRASQIAQDTQNQVDGPAALINDGKNSDDFDLNDTNTYRFSHGSSVQEDSLLSECPYIANDIFDCCRNGDAEGVKVILDNQPLKTLVKDECGYTPLHWACRYGSLPVVSVILEYNPDIDSKTCYGDTPLHMAAQEGYKEICEILISNGANINIRTKYGCTSLHLAARYNHPDICRLLIRCKACIYDKNKNGRTPLDLAASTEIRNILTDSCVVNIHEKYNNKI